MSCRSPIVCPCIVTLSPLLAEDPASKLNVWASASSRCGLELNQRSVRLAVAERGYKREINLRDRRPIKNLKWPSSIALDSRRLQR